MRVLDQPYRLENKDVGILGIFWLKSKFCREIQLRSVTLGFSIVVTTNQCQQQIRSMSLEDVCNWKGQNKDPIHKNRQAGSNLGAFWQLFISVMFWVSSWQIVRLICNSLVSKEACSQEQILQRVALGRIFQGFVGHRWCLVIGALSSSWQCLLIISSHCFS